MNTLDSLLAAVAADPTDDARRLALADFAAEHDLPDVERDQRLAVALRRVLASPDDDAPRLAYAEVCEQFGEVERAEFIRGQCELEKFRGDKTRCPVCNWPLEGRGCHLDNCSFRPREGTAVYHQWIAKQREYQGLVRRERTLWDNNAADWVMVYGMCQFATRATAAFQGESAHAAIFGVDDEPGQGRIEQLFRRGFLDSVACSGEVWGWHGDAICAAHPVRRVTFTDHAPTIEDVWENRGDDAYEYRMAGQWAVVPRRDQISNPDPAIAINFNVRLLLSKRWPSVPPEGWEFPATRPWTAEDVFHEHAV